MASKFINTKHKMILNSLVEGFKEQLKNPYYIHMDSKPNVTCYYNQNTNLSTLDEGSKLQYSPLGKNSPTKYNMINDLYIYGLDRIITDMENGEWGLESNSIEGEAIILPNTIVPIPNDYFTINCIDKKLLFKVTSVTSDTIENGANFYKIDYKLDQLTDEAILKQVSTEYNMILNNVGTQYKSIIRSNDYNFIDKVGDMLDRLRVYYKDLFYSSRVQTFILIHNDTYFYDPYLIEFIKRNDIVNTGDEYLFVTHQTKLQNTFSIDYDKTFFRYTEMPDRNTAPYIYSQGKYIDDAFSIFECRKELYYKIEYTLEHIDNGRYTLNNFDARLLINIKDNIKYTSKHELYKNIIIKYFNSEEIDANDISSIEYMQFSADIEFFYNIPIVIFIIENIIQKLLK